MAGFIPNQYLAVVLETLVGRTAVAAGTVYLGIATGLADDPKASTLASIAEVTTAGYARKAIPAFGPASVLPVQITTPTAFSFAALTADMAVPANYGFITDAANGTVGNLRYVFDLAEAIQAKAGDPINVTANSLIIE